MKEANQGFYKWWVVFSGSIWEGCLGKPVNIKLKLHSILIIMGNMDNSVSISKYQDIFFFKRSFDFASTFVWSPAERSIY